MAHQYYSDRVGSAKARVLEEVSQSAWGGLFVAIRKRIDDGSLGNTFPEECPDGNGPYGTSETSLYLAVQAEVPDIEWPPKAEQVPPTLALLDLLEFLFMSVGQPILGSFHSFWSHTHLRFDPQAGKDGFRNDINRIFARNGIAYELNPNGMVVRLMPEVFQGAVGATEFRTGDKDLDDLLITARARFLSPDLEVRRDGLEKLWDAWERLKTIEPGKDKKQSAQALLDKAIPEAKLRATVDAEAVALTAIGNNFRIRHAEVSQVPISEGREVDYLFYRLFSLIRLLLLGTGRVR